MADVDVDFDDETTTNSTTPVRLRGDSCDARIGSRIWESREHSP